jgi:hypothetical protein
VGPEADANAADPALVVWFWWLVFAPAWVVVTIGATLGYFARNSLDLGSRSQLPAAEIVGLVRTADSLLLIGSALLLLAAPLALLVHGQIDRARRHTFASWVPARPDLGEPSPLH